MRRADAVGVIVVSPFGNLTRDIVLANRERFAQAPVPSQLESEHLRAASPEIRQMVGVNRLVQASWVGVGPLIDGVGDSTIGPR